MEHVLQKMARQLDALDEASLMALWEQYAERVANFEPTKRWEEAVLIFSFIQGKHWKNQLFNQHYAEQRRPHLTTPEAEVPTFVLEQDVPKNSQRRAAILNFSVNPTVDAQHTTTEDSSNQDTNN